MYTHGFSPLFINRIKLKNNVWKINRTELVVLRTPHRHDQIRTEIETAETTDHLKGRTQVHLHMVGHVAHKMDKAQDLLKGRKSVEVVENDITNDVEA